MSPWIQGRARPAPCDLQPGLLEEQVRELLGVVPSYYLRYYYSHDEVLHEQLGAPTRADEVQEVERMLLAKYADPAVDTKPEELSKRGGAFYSDAAVDLLASLTSDRGDVQGGPGNTRHGRAEPGSHLLRAVRA